MSTIAATGNTLPSVTTVALLGLSWTLLTFVVRAWVKLKKADVWALDDTLVTIALIPIILHVICLCKAIDNGFGRSWSSLGATSQVTISKLLYVAQILYVLARGGILLSSASFNVRLTQHVDKTTIPKCGMFTCGLYTLTGIFVVAFRGDLRQPWMTRDGTLTMYIRWMGIEIIGCVLEVMISATSIYFIGILQMPLSRKIRLSILFACRLVVIPFATLRLIQLSPSKATNTDFPVHMAYVYTEMAVEFAFICASITCLKPFLRPFHSGYSVGLPRTSQGLEPQGITKDSRSDSYYVLSQAQSVDQNTANPIQTQNPPHHTITQPAPTFRPDQAKNKATIQSQNPIGKVNTDGPEDMIISLTTEWDVTYEEGTQLESQMLRPP